jgi:hypothetical protein
MVMDVDVQDLIHHIGHDGSHIEWPEIGDDPWQRRAFHIQEILYVAHTFYGQHFTVLQPRPVAQCLAHGGNHTYIIDKQERFHQILYSYIGVLIGKVHAVAWDGSRIFDPGGQIKLEEYFPIKEFWMRVN